MLCGVAFDLMVGSSDLLAVYVMTEFGGICAYILAAYYKRDLRSLESGLKYYITGSASSAALLFAMSILYGALNTTNFYEIQRLLEAGGANLPAVVFSIVLFLVALGYKVGLAPFHLWVADVYEGAPTPVTTFVIVFPRVAGLTVLLRCCSSRSASPAQGGLGAQLIICRWSMTIGTVMALRQTSFKRMMAFSGIGHAGCI
jgi:NADH-quinone oxidoreductase subunit N